MARVFWSQAASQDLRRLHQFLAASDAAAARRAIRKIRDGTRRLAMFPLLGRPAADFPPEYREWFIAFSDGGYLVLYRLEGDQVTVLAVRHGREGDYQ